jgi:DNA processing protein
MSAANDAAAERPLGSRMSMGSGGASPRLGSSMSAANDAGGYAASLASLQGLGPQRLRVLLHKYSPQDAWALVLSGRHVTERHDPAPPDLAAKLQQQARSTDPAEMDDRLRRHDTAVHILGDDTYPFELASDAFAPAVLFSSGDITALSNRRVGMVGTRRATAAGRSIAMEIAVELARSGVAIISGLALGIDGAAHRGALACTDLAKPVAVVGSGIDHPYPERHTELWNEVRERGLILAEVPPGTPPMAFRFPLRNRIIAALSEVLVVVESHERGGSLITAHEALERDRTVMAVPGSPRNTASIGTNMLLRDGALAVQDVNDVLAALGIGQLSFNRSVDPRREPSTDDALVRDAIGDVPVLPEELVHTVGLPFLDVALSLGRLEMAGWVVRSGAFFERVPFVLDPRPVR